jgi:hypothetical protein
MAGGPRAKNKAKLEKAVVWNTDEPEEAEAAVDKIIEAVNDNIIGITEGLVDARNVIADELVIEIQNKIWENRSIVTGRMWDSVSRTPEFLDPKNPNSIFYPVDIGPHVFYAPYVEAKKPFMQPVWNKNKMGIIKRLEETAERITED